MARFDVHELARSGLLVVDVQADIASHLATRVVVPLASREGGGRGDIADLKPEVVVAGEPYIFVSPDLSAIRERDLGAPLANLERDHRDAITRALDLLLTGF